MANTPATPVRDESLLNLLSGNPVLGRAFNTKFPLNGSIVNPFLALQPQNAELFGLLSLGLPQAETLPDGSPEYLLSLVSMVNEMLTTAQADNLDPTLSNKSTGTKTNTLGTIKITGGGETPTFENGTFSVSNKGLTRIWNNPGKIRETLQAEMTEAFDTNEPAKIVEKLTGVELKTDFSEEHKILFAWQLLQQITDDMANQIEKAWQLPKAELKAPATTEIQVGGAVLGKDVVAQIKANKNDPARVEAIVAKALEDATGTTNKAKMTAKIVGVKELKTNHDLQTYAKELFDYTVKDLIKRYTEYV
jgi:hypothetical protein